MKKVFDWLKLHRSGVAFFATFLLMDFGVRASGTKVDYFPWFYPQPTLFSLLWIGLFWIVLKSLPKIARAILYWLLFIGCSVMALANAIYYGLTGIFFSFHIMDMAGEGSSYMLDTIRHANPFIFVWAAVVIGLGVYTFIRLWKEDKYPLKVLGIGLISFVILHLLMPFTLGLKADELQWKSFRKARNVYESYTDYNRSLKVSGFFEYTVRNFYMCKLKPAEKMTAEQEAFLKECYEKDDALIGGMGLVEISRDKLPENPLGDALDYSEYQGIFAGKNVIFLQLEGMDSWLLTEENTPNLWGLKQNSIDFTKHYSLYSGGGSTFNSEFAVNTGFVTPASYTVNAYTLNTNAFPHALPKVFHDLGYRVDAYHMNNGSFYSRDINYKAWGYDHYYGMLDLYDVDEEVAGLDRTLLTDGNFKELLFAGDGAFVDYIITYTPHTPFTTLKGEGQMLAKEQGITEELGEEATAKLMVAETDRMVGLLLKELKARGLYESTVLVCYADHYLYTLNDQSILADKKNATGNLINNTPFFIWSADVNPTKVERVTMQMNILPTVFGLFGISYDARDYLFGNALSDGYTGIACFSDYSWYDGRSYVENGKVCDGIPVNQAYIDAVSEYVKRLYNKNDWTLRYNYFAK